MPDGQATTSAPRMSPSTVQALNLLLHRAEWFSEMGQIGQRSLLLTQSLMDARERREIHDRELQQYVYEVIGLAGTAAIEHLIELPHTS